jgi:hypothetical protein
MFAWQIWLLLKRKREEQRRRYDDGLRGALVGAPAMPEDFE